MATAVNIGMCVIKMKNSENGAPATAGDWKTLPTPREGTTTLNTTAGSAVEAKIEGGEVIDGFSTSSSYTFEWEEWLEKGKAPSFTDNNGIVSGEFAFQCLPARDEAAPSFQIDRGSVSASVEYSVNDGLRVKYSVKVLKPASGKLVKLMNIGE